MCYTPTHIHMQQYKNKGFIEWLFRSSCSTQNNILFKQCASQHPDQVFSYMRPCFQPLEFKRSKILKSKNILSAMKQNDQGL